MRDRGEGERDPRVDAPHRLPDEDARPSRTPRPWRPDRRPRRRRPTASRTRTSCPTLVPHPTCRRPPGRTACAGRRVRYVSGDGLLSCRPTTTRAASTVRALARRAPDPDGAPARRGRLRRARTGREPWGLEADPIHQLVIDDELGQGGRAPAGQPDRHRLGGTDDPLRRHRGAEGALPLADARPARSSGASCSPSRAAAATSPTSAPGRCATATSSSSTGRRSGRAARSTPSSASSSPAPIPTSPSTRASRTSSARWTLPGIEIRPITEMTGGHTFNEVFFTDVRIPAANLVGEQNDGWRLAKVTLGNERISLSSGGVLWGSGPTALDLIEAAKSDGRRHRSGAAPAAMRRHLHRAHAARADPHAHAAPPG